MENNIISFFGEFTFLHTFYESEINFSGIIFPTMEHALTAAMTNDLRKRVEISLLRNPADARNYGYKIIPCKDWLRNHYKIRILESFIDQKFDIVKSPYFSDKLKSTDPKVLANITLWPKDTFFGVYQGEGLDILGKVLMQKRSNLLRNKTPHN